MLSIQTNVNSLVAQQNMSVNGTFQSRTIQRLTSGYRINSSGDDAAGLAVSNKFRNAVSELTQGVANGNDGVAQLQIMDGGISNISQILDRLKTLAMQSASQSFTGDRTQLNSEFQTDVAEIDRQAQSIGLNTGGTFAKNLAVYLGAGSGSQSSANSVVNIDLSKSTVDSMSLGMNGFQAVKLQPAGTANYDLGASSKTSVKAILAANNQTTTSFTFAGPGFGDTQNGTNAQQVTISVNLSGVGDTASLVNNINAAIQQQEANAGGNYAAFTKANIVASIHTDSSGAQQLAFTSATTAFQVKAGNETANALMGNQVNAVGSGAAASITGSTLVALGSYQLATQPQPTGSAPAESDLAFTSLTGTQAITISAVDSNGASHQLTVQFDSDLAASAGTVANAIDTLNNALQASNDSTLQQITAVNTQTTGDTAAKGKFNFISNLKNFTISVGAASAGGITVPTAAPTGFATTGVVAALQVGSGGAADISTISGAQQAVTAITNAVTALGKAQGSIGKGQNQLNYAISLAQSQITNFSSAEAQIRDANVAAEAANLSKAQVLQQAAIAAMAQANSAPQAVLSLLRG